jgi:uncharacterized protein YjdB
MKLRWLIPCLAVVAACHSGESMSTALSDRCTDRLFTDRLAITPTSAVLRVGDTLRLSAALPECVVVTRPQRVLWIASDTAVVSIDTAGLVRARKSGTTTVIATAAPDSTTIQKGAMAVTVSP